MTSSRPQLVIGYSSAFGNLFVATSSAACTQALQGAVPDFQLSVARSLVQSVIYVIGGKIVGSDFKITREMIRGLLYLGFVCSLFNVGYYGATTYLPLTEAFGVLVIAQIISALLHSKLFFYIDVAKSKIVSLFVCVVGIILVAQPSWLFHRLPRNSEAALSVSENISHATHPINISRQYVHEISNREVLLGYILSVIGGAAMGLMYDIHGIILKGLKPIVKVSYGYTLSMMGSVVFMFYMEDPVLTMDLTQFMLVLGHGVLSALSSFLFVLGAHYVPGPTLSVMYSLQMVVLIIYQYTIMRTIQPGNHNWIGVLGCTIIIFGGSIPPLADTLVPQAKSNELPWHCLHRLLQDK